MASLSRKRKNLVLFIGWRLLAVFLTLIFILMICNFVFYVIPGDPARIMLGANASEAQVQALRESLGLDRPWFVQISQYTRNLLRGDLGQSLRFRLPVGELLQDRLGLTVMLAVEALLLAFIFGVPLAVISARRPGGVLDTLINITTQIGLAIPSFFSAILLTLTLAVVFRNFGGVTYVPLAEGVFASMRSLIVPAIAIAIPRIAWVVQFLRQSLIEQKSHDYVRTAKGKGLRPFQIINRHMLRNALVPLVTTMGIISAELIAGSIVVEQVYNLPGLGRLLVTAIESRDFPLTQGIVLVVATAVVVIGFLVDIVNQAIDPRLRLQQGMKGGQ